MKVYFMASPRLVEKDPKLYETIHSCLSKGNRVVDTLVVSEYLKVEEKIKKSDVVVVEISGHSTSLGYLFGKTLDMNKPVVVLHEEGSKSLFLKWLKNEKLIICPYNVKNIGLVLNVALKKAEKMIDVRFNFFVSPVILNYLDWVSSKKMLPRSVFLRNLIEKEIRKDKEYAASL